MIIRELNSDDVTLMRQIINTCDFDDQCVQPNLTRADVIDQFERSFKFDDWVPLIFYDARAMPLGCVLLGVSVEGRQLSFVSGIFAINSVVSSFQDLLKWLAIQYSGYELVVSLRSHNHQLVDFLKSIQHKPAFTAKVVQWQSEQVSQGTAQKLSSCTRSEFEAISQWYDAEFSDTFWNSRRILTQFEQWEIFMLQRHQRVSEFVGGCYSEKRAIFEVFATYSTADLRTVFEALNQQLIKQHVTSGIWMLDETSREYQQIDQLLAPKEPWPSYFEFVWHF
ncbi:hypothetical protein ACFQ4L_00865 [Lapidilactobacillus mulanensis]|uniref:GNAT family N-acetyltransferase n=1 Tax=Lapidilactobacillus mulanensis TaxID=2485999 RepID=A0ABW4DLI7_9LACO|nr:hypothetical protein [Lapidilactobacillus mulanensis]